MSPEQRTKRGLRDPSENRNLQATEHQKVDQTGRDQRLLEVWRDSLSDAQHEAEKHGCVGRGQHSVDGAGVPGADGGGQPQQAVMLASHVDARRLQLEVSLALSEVRAPIEGRKVS